VVHRQSGTLLGIMDAAFKIDQPIALAVGRHAQTSGGVAHAFIPYGFFGGARRLVSAFIVRKQVGLSRIFPSEEREVAYF
jgi:hypothetical protein